MKKDIFAVYVTTFYLVVYTLLLQAGVDYAFVAAMFCVSPVMVLWMVYRVLTSPDEPTRTFDDYFYMDSSVGPTKTHYSGNKKSSET